MMLPNISEFIKNYVTKRENSFFENDLINNKEKLSKEIKGKINFSNWRRWDHRFFIYKGSTQISSL